MASMTSNRILKTLSLISFLAGINLSLNAVADEHETACSKHIQDKTSWDYDG